MPVQRQEIEARLERLSHLMDLPVKYLRRIIKAESNWDPRNITGKYRGLAQISPENLALFNRNNPPGEKWNAKNRPYTQDDLLDPIAHLDVLGYLWTRLLPIYRRVLELIQQPWGENPLRDAIWFYWGWLTGTHSARGLPGLLEIIGDGVQRGQMWAKQHWPQSQRSVREKFAAELGAGDLLDYDRMDGKKVTPDYVVRFRDSLDKYTGLGEFVGNQRKLNYARRAMGQVATIPPTLPSGPATPSGGDGSGDLILLALLALALAK